MDHALGRSRGGFGTKVHLVADSRGLPLGVRVSAGQRHESTCFEPLLESIRIRRANGHLRRRPTCLAGDKGYSFLSIRRWLHRHKVRGVLPQRATQEGQRGGCRRFDPIAYPLRNAIARCVSWLKECRRVATRFEKLAVRYLAILKVAIIQRYLRVLFRNTP